MLSFELANRCGMRVPSTATCVAGTRRAALEVYARDVLNAKAPPTSATAAGLKYLLAACSNADFEVVLQPQLQKLLRKNPDSILPTVAGFLESATSMDFR